MTGRQQGSANPNTHNQDLVAVTRQFWGPDFGESGKAKSSLIEKSTKKGEGLVPAEVVCLLSYSKQSLYGPHISLGTPSLRSHHVFL